MICDKLGGATVYKIIIIINIFNWIVYLFIYYLVLFLLFCLSPD